MVDERTVEKYIEQFTQKGYTLEQLLDIAESNFHLYEKLGDKIYEAKRLAAEKIIIDLFRKLLLGGVKNEQG